MARNNNKPDVYKGRRKKLNVLGIVLSAVAVLIVALFVLFGAFQKYIVYSNNGISLELPILATPGAEEEEGERVFEQVNAELEITDPDYSDIESQIDEEMEPLRAIFVPAENVNTEGITPYVNKLNSVGGNALGLQNYQFAAITFAATLAIAGVGLLIYRRICLVHQEHLEHKQHHKTEEGPKNGR